MKMLTPLVLLFLLVSPVLAQPECPPPQAVDLVSFTVSLRGNTRVIDWESAGETDNLGYHLYGSYTADGHKYKLNRELIPALHPGTVQGGKYQFVSGIGHHYYWLEDVDTSGIVTEHGPARVLARRMQLVRQRPIAGGLFFRGR